MDPTDAESTAAPPPIPLEPLTARRGRAASAGALLDVLHLVPPPLPSADLDRWAVDVDHDRRVLRAAATGDGPPPAVIRVEAPAHDAPREIVLQLVGADGRRWVSTAVVPGWSV